MLMITELIKKVSDKYCKNAIVNVVELKGFVAYIKNILFLS